MLWRYIDRLNAGERLDDDTIRSEEPELAEDLIRELETFRVLGSDTPDSPLGQLGDYTLRRQIGRGGMGVVYEAWENSMDRAVALKVLPAAIAADSRAITRFLREAQTAGKLNHPNVVGVYSTGVKEGTPWYAMELVEGETLAQVLARFRDAELETETPFGKKDSVVYFANLARAFADVADGLQHAHSNGVTHRDIKPSNLILDRDGRLRILDFGLARLEGQQSLTLSGDFVGTPLYMSSEQARQKKIPVDHRTDVYALGATMYEAICGRPPFRGKDHADTLSQIIERDPVEPRKVNAMVPKDLETIVLKCLRKDSGDRYGTAEALGQDLRRFVRGDPVEAKAPADWERLQRWLRRHGRRIAGVSVLFILLAVTTFLGVATYKQRSLEESFRYGRIVSESLVDLDVGLLTGTGQADEGEAVSLGVLYLDEFDWVRRDHLADVYEATLERLDEAIQLRPDRPEAHLLKRRAFLALNRHEEAAQSLQAALACEPRFLPALLHRAHELRTTGKSEQAKALLEELYASHRTGWEGSWLDAHAAAGRGDWETYDRICSELLDEAADPPFHGYVSELRLKRGRSSLKRGVYWRAVEDFVSVRDSSTGSVGPEVLLANTYYLMDEKDAARTTLDDALRRLPGPSSALTVEAAYSRFGERDKSREAVDSISDPGTRQQALSRVYFRRAKYEQAVEAGEKAIDIGVKEPGMYSLLAWCHLEMRHPGEAEKVLSRGLSRFPEHKQLIADLGWAKMYAGQFEPALDLFKRALPLAMAYQGAGWCTFHLNEPDECITFLSAAIERYPRLRSTYYGRARAHYFLGQYAEAVNDAVQAVLTKPDTTDALKRILEHIYSPERRGLFSAHWDHLKRAYEKSAQRGRISPSALAFLALSYVYNTQPDLEKAFQYADTAVERSHGLSGRLLWYLAEVHAARGDLERAILGLERAQNVLHRRREAPELLRRYREKVFPDLVSCASVDAFVKDLRALPAKAAASRLKSVLAALESESAELSAYLRACLLEEDGKSDRAALELEKLILDRGMHEEAAIVKLARLWSRAGRRGDALTLIEEKALAFESATVTAWRTWLDVASDEPAMSPGDLLARLSRLVNTNHTEQAEFLGSKRPFLASVRWLLGELASSGEIRIDCGSRQDTVDGNGREWSRDRCYEGGQRSGRYMIPHTGLEVPPYERARWWRGGLDTWTAPGYRIPVPDGHYELTLYLSRRNRAERDRDKRLVNIV